MSEEGLIGGAAAKTEDPKPPEGTEISHVEKPKEQPAGAVDTNQWIDGVSKTLYADGKPNFEQLPEKYWKDGVPDLQSALKARSELEKAFSRGDHKAPAEYDTGVAKSAGVPDDDPLLGSFKSWAKDQGISQDAFNKLTQNYIEMMQQNQPPQLDVAAEKAKLGPNADKVISEMTTWGQNMVRKGVWSENDFQEFKYMGGTAAGLNALMKIREYYGDMKRIPVDAAVAGDAPTRAELDAMVADPKYKTDPAFRQKVERLFEKMYAD